MTAQTEIKRYYILKLNSRIQILVTFIFYSRDLKTFMKIKSTLTYMIYLSLYTLLLNIMFHAPMESFQLELIYYFTFFSTVVRSNICVILSSGPSVVNTTFSTGLVGVEVSSVS